jgi:hypothetical protein
MNLELRLAAAARKSAGSLNYMDHLTALLANISAYSSLNILPWDFGAFLLFFLFYFNAPLYPN